MCNNYCPKTARLFSATSVTGTAAANAGVLAGVVATQAGTLSPSSRAATQAGLLETFAPAFATERLLDLASYVATMEAGSKDFRSTSGNKPTTIEGLAVGICELLSAYWLGGGLDAGDGFGAGVGASLLAGVTCVATRGLRVGVCGGWPGGAGIGGNPIKGGGGGIGGSPIKTGAGGTGTVGNPIKAG